MERFDRSWQPDADEDRTQVIRPSWSSEGPPGRERAREDRPGIEPASTERPRDDRRPRSPADRAAARARRRKQIRRRRLVALAVVVLVVLLLVLLLVRGCGGPAVVPASAVLWPPSVALLGVKVPGETDAGPAVTRDWSMPAVEGRQ